MIRTACMYGVLRDEVPPKLRALKEQLIEAVYAEFDEWLAEHDREISERVWDEACDAGIKHDHNSGLIWFDNNNPYRKES